MFSHFLAALVAFFWSFRHQKTFQIKAEERRRYWLKSVHLALCYRGFAPDCKPRSLMGAGKAAFFCCAYDVVTDWRDFDPKLFESFESLLRRSVPAEAAELALTLYKQEKMDLLTEDGLSRGTVALEFVTKLMNTESYIRQRTDFNHLGIIMQIVDDVLDLEEDKREHKTNCLFSSGREEYLSLLAKFPINENEGFLPGGRILWNVVRSAQQKAEGLVLRQNQRTTSKTPVDIEGSPYQHVT